NIPEVQTEAMRDLERARDDAKKAERGARHQLDKFLLRHGRSWSQGSKWTVKHWAWVRAQQFPEKILQRVLEDSMTTIQQAAPGGSWARGRGSRGAVHGARRRFKSDARRSRPTSGRLPKRPSNDCRADFKDSPSEERRARMS